MPFAVGLRGRIRDVHPVLLQHLVSSIHRAGSDPDGDAVRRRGPGAFEEKMPILQALEASDYQDDLFVDRNQLILFDI